MKVRQGTVSFYPIIPICVLSRSIKSTLQIVRDKHPMWIKLRDYVFFAIVLISVQLLQSRVKVCGISQVVCEGHFISLRTTSSRISLLIHVNYELTGLYASFWCYFSINLDFISYAILTLAINYNKLKNISVQTFCILSTAIHALFYQI